MVQRAERRAESTKIMDLSQLRTLLAVAELGSLSKAADRLRIAQPALSRQIRLLEDELGTPLFERHGRGMVITEIGRQIVGRAARILSEVNEIFGDVADLSASLSGHVVIGMPPTVAEIITVPLVAAFRDSHPNMELRFVSAFTGYLLDWLQRGEIDVAVLYDPRPTRSLRSTPLLLESLFLIGPAGSPLSLYRAVPFRQLGAETLFLPSQRHGLRSILERYAADAGITLTVRVEADSLSTLKDLVKSGLGTTVLPLPSIHDDVAAGRLTAAPLIDPSPTRRLVLSFPSDRPISRAARFAADSITAIATELVTRGVWSGHLLQG